MVKEKKEERQVPTSVDARASWLHPALFGHWERRTRNQREPWGCRVRRPGDPPWTPAPVLPLGQAGLPLLSLQQPTLVLPATDVKPPASLQRASVLEPDSAPASTHRIAAPGHQSNKENTKK